MHIGIDAEAANRRAKSGIEHYSKQLILHLAQIDKTHRYTLYLRREAESWLLELPPNFCIKVIPFPLFWTQLRLSWEMLRHPVDVLFVPLHRLPMIHPRRSVVTLHDTNFVINPDTDTAFWRRFQYWSFRYLVAVAAHIIAISDATRQDLIRHFRADPQRTGVVYHGYERAEESAGSAPPRGLPDRYLLFLSTIQPRKNLVRLIDAFVALKRGHPELPHKLVIAGALGWKYGDILDRIRLHSDQVVYIGGVEDAERWPLYRGADLYVLPSVNEGFGMGVLEAFYCGVPAALSNVSSLPEVAGDAALYFDPLDEEQITAAMLRGLTDDALRQELVARGTARLAQFSWERCARETLAVIERLGVPAPAEVPLVERDRSPWWSRRSR